MRQAWITGHGGPDKLVLRESPDPRPTRSELRVRVKASGVNFADILARLGLYPDAPKPWRLIRQPSERSGRVR